MAVALFHSGMTCRAVSRVLLKEFGVNVSAASVALWARRAGVWRRRGGRPLPLPGLDLRRAYEAGTPVRQLARDYSVSQRLIRERLREVGTPMRPGGTVYPVLTRELLQDLYVRQRMTAAKIAARVGCSEATVTWRLRAYRLSRGRTSKNKRRKLPRPSPPSPAGRHPPHRHAVRRS